MQHHRQRKSKHQVLASKDDDNCVSDAWSRMGRSKTVNAQQILHKCAWCLSGVWFESGAYFGLGQREQCNDRCN
jgi:hypothetical protein